MDFELLNHYNIFDFPNLIGTKSTIAEALLLKKDIQNILTYGGFNV